MGIETAAWLIVGIGLSLLASKLLASKQPRPTLDQTVSTTSQRGSFIPWIKGRRLIGPTIGWVGDRYTHKEKANGGKKGGSSSSSASKVTIYNEAGWHQLCIGPAYALHAIYQSGKQIFNGPITINSHPSGSFIDLGKEGGFYIYWGDQASFTGAGLTYLGGKVGVNSRWPKLCFILWKYKRLGQSAVWADIKYELEVRTQNTVLSGTTDTLGNGLNPANVLAEVLFAPWPNGLNLDQNDWDIDSLEDIATEAEEDDLYTSWIAADGATATSIIANFMQDFGYMLPMDQLTGKMKFVPIREPTGTLRTLKDEMITKPPQKTTNHGERPVDRMLFVFPDRSHRYRDMPIKVDDDSQAEYLNHARAKRIGLSTVVDFEPAAFLAERRGQEERAGGSSLIYEANHAARTLEPGMAILSDDFDDVLRISSVEMEPNKGDVRIHAFSDFYGIKKSNYITDEGGGELIYLDPEEDEAVGFVEYPEFMLSGFSLIVAMFLKIRKHAQIIGSSIWIKLAADSEYTHIGDTSAVITGGLLQEELLASGYARVDEGPLISPKGPDIATVTDQSTTNWRLGRQIAICNQEIMYLDKLTSMSGDYRLDGLLRGRLGTKLQTHSINDPVFILSYDVLEYFSDIIFSPGATIDIKLQPYSGGGAVDLSTITPLQVTLVGKGIVPMRVPNLRVSEPWNQVNAYSTGDNIKFKWAYMSALSPGTGAGSQSFGNPVGSADVDGEFLLEIRNTADTTTLRSVSTTNLEYEYSNANLVSDFSGEPASFPVRISNTRGGYQSEYTEITVVKVT